MTTADLFLLVGLSLMAMCALDAVLTRWPGEDRLARWLRLGDD